MTTPTAASAPAVPDTSVLEARVAALEAKLAKLCAHFGVHDDA